MHLVICACLRVRARGRGESEITCLKINTKKINEKNLYEAKQEIREGGADPGSFLPQGLND